jgi:hypothetical protein
VLAGQPGRAFLSAIASSVRFCSSSALPMRSTFSTVSTSAPALRSISARRRSFSALKLSNDDMNSSKASATSALSGADFSSGAA